METRPTLVQVCGSRIALIGHLTRLPNPRILLGSSDRGTRALGRARLGLLSICSASGKRLLSSLGHTRNLVSDRLNEDRGEGRPGGRLWQPIPPPRSRLSRVYHAALALSTGILGHAGQSRLSVRRCRAGFHTCQAHAVGRPRVGRPPRGPPSFRPERSTAK
jgi:hypothetical protein